MRISDWSSDVCSSDLAAYAGAVLDRFRNPAIRHRLSQIAWDGSPKLPYRLLDTPGEAHAAGRPVDRLAVPVAPWMAFISRMARGGQGLADTLASRLFQLARQSKSETPRGGNGGSRPRMF